LAKIKPRTNSLWRNDGHQPACSAHTEDREYGQCGDTANAQRYGETAGRNGGGKVRALGGPGRGCGGTLRRRRHVPAKIPPKRRVRSRSTYISRSWQNIKNSDVRRNCCQHVFAQRCGGVQPRSRRQLSLAKKNRPGDNRPIWRGYGLRVWQRRRKYPFKIYLSELFSHIEFLDLGTSGSPNVSPLLCTCPSLEARGCRMATNSATTSTHWRETTSCAKSGSRY